MFETDFGTAGVRADVASGEREWLYAASASPNNSPPVYLAGGRIIDGTKARDLANTGDADILRPGLPMGRITASGKYANAIIGASGVLHDTSVVTTVMTLPAAVVAEIVRRIGASGTFKITGPPTANGTVATEVVTYSAAASATTLTITATAADFAAGSFIRPNDGSETIKGGLDEWVKVTSNVAVDQDTRMRRLCVAGFAKTSQIIGYPTDTSLLAWLKAQLNDPSNGPGPFRFDDNF